MEVYGNQNRNRVMVTAICFCGKEFKVSLDNLKRNTNSCGCTRYKYSHQMTATRLYYIWSNMIQRCTNSKNKNYHHYGGRGISVCTKWQKFSGFYKDVKLGYKDNLTLERINVNGNYCKQNCRWATIKEQSLNKRNSLIWKNQNASIISIKLGGNADLISKRIQRGWSKEKAFTIYNTKK